MKNKTLLLIPLLAWACTTTSVPVKRNFPEAPPELMVSAPELKPLPPDTVELSALIDNANENYYSYRKLRELFDGWKQWYQEQRDNFNSVK